MTATKRGNQKWRALSDAATRDGKPAIPDAKCCTCAGEDAMLPQKTPILTTSLRKWLSAFLPDVAAGRLDLGELLHVVDEDLQHEPMVCPSCTKGWYRRSSGPGWRQGICTTCYLEKLRVVHEEKLRELEARREVVAIKREVSRARDRLDPDRERAHPPFRVCDVCGDRMPPEREWEPRTCAGCLERTQNHQRPERVPMVRPQDEYGRLAATVPQTGGAALGARMLTCSCGFTRPQTATDNQDRCPDCLERDQARERARRRGVM